MGYNSVYLILACLWMLHNNEIETINIYLFHGRSSGITRVSWYQKGKTNLDFTEARDSEW